MHIILFILFLVFIGFILAGVMAPVIIVMNKKQIRKMEEIVENARNSRTVFDRMDTIRQLYRLKKKIWIGDKTSVARAEDLINEVATIPDLE